MEKQDIVKYFSNILEKEKDVATGLATIMTLLEVLKQDKSKTMQELVSVLRAASNAMGNTDYPSTTVSSCYELFFRFITSTDLHKPSFTECKEIMIQRGENFLKKHKKSRSKIANDFINVIKNGARILTHSKSPVVLQAILEAAKAFKKFEVFVTTSDIDNSGVEMYKALQEANIECTLVLDSAIGYIMEQVDIVMVGAEGVASCGGIINTIGTFPIAVCAKEMNKDFYVLAESYTFVDYFPSNLRDLSADFKYPASKLQSDLSKEHPLVDYTPPTYIKVLFTDLGILPPTTVSYVILTIYE